MKLIQMIINLIGNQRKYLWQTAFLLLTVLWGCSEDEPDYLPELVVEGYIDSGGRAVAQLTYSLSPDEKSHIYQKVIALGKITVSDGTESEVLVGAKTADWLPPYRYFGEILTGEPGKTYTVTAEYEGHVATASVRMPEPTPIDKLNIEKIAGIDTLRNVTLEFTAPADCPAYYYLSIAEAGKRQQSLPCYMGVVSCTQPGRKISVGVFQPKTFNNKSYVMNLRTGRDYVVELNRVSPEVFAFRQTYNEMLVFSHNPFLSTAQTLPTNISGGLGIWSAQGTSRQFVSVP